MGNAEGKFTSTVRDEGRRERVGAILSGASLFPGAAVSSEFVLKFVCPH